ncbi:NADH-cytochrome b5 reductase [Bulinus truncatus]|nr:NADH-cytochrome b5 reductase [Bulinus truncatus]
MSTKVAVVTGANKGLGFAIVRGLCKAFEGDVYLTARDEGRGKAAVAELEKEDLHPKFHQLDISDHESIVRLKDFLQTNYGGLDLLVNNAAIAYEFNNAVNEILTGLGMDSLLPSEWLRLEEVVTLLEPFAVQTDILQSDTQSLSTIIPSLSVPSPPIAQAADEVCKINYFGTLDVCQVLFPLLRPHARVCHLSSINSEFSLAECSDELKARVRRPDMTIDDVSALINEFIEAAKKNELKEKGFDNSPYGISKIGVSLITPIQQKLLDESGAQDIVVNCCDVGLVSTDMTGGAGMPIDQGAMTPLYCCLLPPDEEKPRGKFIMNKRVYDWINN